MHIEVMSFGYKYNLPPMANLVFDVRCVPNPFYIDELKHKNGLSEEVRSYVLQFDKSKAFLSKVEEVIDFSLPIYEEDGRSEFVIAFGCTGGHHRSVTFAEEVYHYLADQGYDVSVLHRDIEK